MMVGIDQSGHDQAATRVYRAIDRVLVRREIANVDDVVTFDEDAAILDEAVVFIEGYEVSVGYQQ
jgi:predicted transcriptional regulator